MPKLRALSAFEPGASPVITKFVDFETLLVTLAPILRRVSLASSRVMLVKLPVSTTVLPESFPAITSEPN